MANRIPPFFLDRLRNNPIRRTVPDSLPVLFFGDLFAASIATIGINPSHREYLSKAGKELDGVARRFETLGSLNAPTRVAITDVQAVMAIERMRGYFDAGKPTYTWFNGLRRVVEGIGFSFAEHSAAHLDLVQEATKPAWSGLRSEDRAQADAVLERDLPFLQQQIEQLPLRAVVCTSARVLNNVSAMLHARKIAEGADGLIKWTVSVADTPRGIVGIAGWNIPLARPTGLDREGQRRLGELLVRQLKEAGVLL